MTSTKTTMNNNDYSDNNDNNAINDRSVTILPKIF